MTNKKKYQKISYSQGGEDLIVEFIFNVLGMSKVKYIDIGAHHPYHISNTALLYSHGSTGICIEPDPDLFKEIKKIRKNDICLNIGIGLNEILEKDFYIMSTPSLNTFCQNEAEKYEQHSPYKINKIIKVPLKNINNIIDEHMAGTPDFISIDVEGLDLEILKSIDYEKYKPTVICVESLNYVKEGIEQKDLELIDYLSSKNYFIYADTYMNTIFVDTLKWQERAE